MTTLANVKGYINGNEWGVYRQLLSYSQLAALTSADAVDEELNADPTRYYNALDGDSHVGNIDGSDYIVDDLGEKTIWAQSGGYMSDGNYAFYFDDGWIPESQLNLLSYEELVALNNASAIKNELNTNPISYYDLYNNQGHIKTFDGYNYSFLTEENQGNMTQIGGYNFAYYFSTHEWDLYEAGPV